MAKNYKSILFRMPANNDGDPEVICHVDAHSLAKSINSCLVWMNESKPPKEVDGLTLDVSGGGFFFPDSYIGRDDDVIGWLEEPDRISEVFMMTEESVVESFPEEIPVDEYGARLISILWHASMRGFSTFPTEICIHALFKYENAERVSIGVKISELQDIIMNTSIDVHSPKALESAWKKFIL